jgi:hypothetical protein
MWRTTLLIALCLSACHHSAAPSTEAPAPTAETARTGEAALTPGTDAGAAARTPPAQTPPASMEPLAADPAEAEARCTRDADCTLTRLSDEGCCPTLCTPRAISTTALARRQKSCANFQESSCAESMCRAPRGAPSAVCQGGRCTVRLTSME